MPRIHVAENILIGDSHALAASTENHHAEARPIARGPMDIDVTRNVGSSVAIQQMAAIARALKSRPDTDPGRPTSSLDAYETRVG